MSQLSNQINREWRFMLRQKYILILLLCSFVATSFAIVSGISETNQQRQTIERLKQADEIDRAEAQAKYDDVGALAYYSFHLSYSEPSDLAFAALGERDIYPWKHRIRMLALEGQIYESDAQNAELAQAGKIDFVFIISALSPLLIILLFHDLFAHERSSGRYDLLVSTTSSSFGLWGARAIVRFIALYICLLVPFLAGAMLSGVAFVSIILVSVIVLIYMLFWTALSVWWAKRDSTAPRIASSLIGMWVLLAFIIPILGDLAINHSVHAPKGGDIVLTQREAVNDGWDLPKETTMNAFAATHPKFKDGTKMDVVWDWKWYYAFQQVGDQKVADLSQAFRDASQQKYDLAGYASLLSPPILLQRAMTRLANTDALAAFEYEQQIRDYHEQLRMFYYPFMFEQSVFEKSQLDNLPIFDELASSQNQK